MRIQVQVQIHFDRTAIEMNLEILFFLTCYFGTALAVTTTTTTTTILLQQQQHRPVRILVVPAPQVQDLIGHTIY